MNNTDIILPIRKDSHFVKLPFIALDELDPFEIALFALYTRLSWGSGDPVSLSGPKGSKSCQMGINKFYSTRASLHEKGYIVLTKSDEYEQAFTVEVCWEKMWERNAEKYKKYQSSQEIGSDLMVHVTSGKLENEQLEALKSAIEQMLGVHQVYGGGAPYLVQGAPYLVQGCTIFSAHLVDIESIDKESILPDGSSEPPAAEIQPRRDDYESLNPNHTNREIAPQGQPVKKNIMTLALIEMLCSSYSQNAY